MIPSRFFRNAVLFFVFANSAWSAGPVRATDLNVAWVQVLALLRQSVPPVLPAAETLRVTSILEDERLGSLTFWFSKQPLNRVLHFNVVTPHGREELRALAQLGQREMAASVETLRILTDEDNTPPAHIDAAFNHLRDLAYATVTCWGQILQRDGVEFEIWQKKQEFFRQPYRRQARLPRIRIKDSGTHPMNALAKFMSALPGHPYTIDLRPLQEEGLANPALNLAAREMRLDPAAVLDGLYQRDPNVRHELFHLALEDHALNAPAERFWGLTAAPLSDYGRLPMPGLDDQFQGYSEIAASAFEVLLALVDLHAEWSPRALQSLRTRATTGELHARRMERILELTQRRLMVARKHGSSLETSQRGMNTFLAIDVSESPAASPGDAFAVGILVARGVAMLLPQHFLPVVIEQVGRARIIAQKHAEYFARAKNFAQQDRTTPAADDTEALRALARDADRLEIPVAPSRFVDTTALTRAALIRSRGGCGEVF